MTHTFESFSSEWQETVLPLKARATQAQFKSHIRQFNLAFGPLPLADLNNHRVQSFLTQQAKSKTPTTVRNIWLTLRLILDNARRGGFIAALPEPVLPKRRPVQQEWLTGEQMRALVSSAEGLHKACYALMCEAGLRIGEVLGLQPCHVDLGKQTISIKQSVYAGAKQAPKTHNSVREICISGWLADLLDDVVQKTDKRGFLFSTSKGTPWWPGEVQKQMNALLNRLGIESVGFHAIRRGSITLCATTIGMPETVIAQRVGHACKGLTFGTYAQRVSEADREWVEKIADVLR